MSNNLAIFSFNRQRKSNIDPNMILEDGQLFVELPDNAILKSEYLIHVGSEDDYFKYLNSMLCNYKIGDGKTKWEDLQYSGKIPAAVKMPKLNDDKQKVLIEYKKID